MFKLKPLTAAILVMVSAQAMADVTAHPSRTRTAPG